MSVDVNRGYGISRRVDLPFDEAVEKIRAALKEEGFGVLTEIDVQRTIREKLGLDFRKYVILGGCNPRLAHRALEAELEIGLLLPCNVIVYEEDGGAVVAVQNPEAALGLVGNPLLEPVAREAATRLERALHRLPESP